MKVRSLILAALVPALLPAIANAAISVSLVPVASPANVPAGFTPYDLKITTDTDWTNQSLTLTVTQGSIYQDALGNDVQPNPSFLSIAPSLQWDTYFTTPGGFPNIAGQGTLPSFAGSESMSTTSIHADQWFDTANTGPGTFIVAQITLSNNAVGSFSGQAFNTLSGGNGTPFSGTFGAVPEPTTLAALSIGSLALLARKRRSA